MASVTINLRRREPKIGVLTMSDRRSFIVVRLDDDASMYLEGFDQEAIDHARDIAAALTDAADQIERLMAAPAPTAVSEAAEAIL